MGNRSRYVAAGTAAALGTAYLARRRMLVQRAAEGIEASIMPSRATPPADDEPPTDEAHAPGHRHLAVERDGHRHRWTRPVRKQRHDQGHPHPDR